MLKNILSSELREKAGSDSYNRYEYQVYWIVYHMIQSFEQGKDFLVFCEYHDDMAKCNSSTDPQSMDFYQVKTSETKKSWSLDSLFKRTKRKSGDYKHSFLGFIFYNFMKFGSDCSECYFVTNIHPDKNILKWQAAIKDKKQLKVEDVSLYDDIKKRMRSEFSKINQSEFDSLFDLFVQKTFISRTDLPLETHDKHVKGQFFEMTSKFNLDMGNGYRLLTDIINLVQKKTKTKIHTPISYAELKDKKGVSSDIFNALKDKFNEIVVHNKVYDKVVMYLEDNNVKDIKISFFIKKLKKHHAKKLDIRDILYQDIINDFLIQCEKIIDENIDQLHDINIADQLIQPLISDTLKKQHQDIDSGLLKGVFYETISSPETITV